MTWLGLPLLPTPAREHGRAGRHQEPPRQLCEWFARCIRPADGTVDHPVLDPVPTCQPCATLLGLDLVRYPTRSA